MVTAQPDGTIEFAYFRPSAQVVALAGDFNDWHESKLQMTSDGNGWWRLKLMLPPGEYRFKYVVDEKHWEADFAAYGVENDRQGDWNSVLWVAPLPQTRQLRLVA